MYLTLNSEFRPFTYDELVKPLSDYTEAYNKVEEQYATLAQQTEAWKNIATQENSPEAYAMYKKYSDELNAVVEDFSKGMTIQNRSKLLGLKSRYASEITPIANAYESFQKANAYRDAIKVQDPSAIFNIDKYYSIDDFLNGQSSDNNFISGDNIQANIASQVLSNSYIKYNELINAGHSKKSAANIVSKGDWVDESSMLEDIYSSSGIASKEAADRTKSYVDKGIKQGISTFYINEEKRLFDEEIELRKLNRNNNTGNKGGEDNSIEDLAIKYYTLFELPTSEDIEETTNSEIITDPDTEYESRKTSSSISTRKRQFSKDEVERKAKANPDARFGAELEYAGYTKEQIKDMYIKYQESISSLEDKSISFREWVDENPEIAASVL